MDGYFFKVSKGEGFPKEKLMGRLREVSFDEVVLKEVHGEYASFYGFVDIHVDEGDLETLIDQMGFLADSDGILNDNNEVSGVDRCFLKTVEKE